MTESTSEFALQLRSLREARGLSLRALASLVGVSSVTVWKWEKGDSKPRSRLIAPLARALEVPPAQFESPAKGGESLGEAVAAGGAEMTPAGPSNSLVHDQVSSTDQGEALSEVIARAKHMIAEASGTGSNNITILIEY